MRGADGLLKLLVILKRLREFKISPPLNRYNAVLFLYINIVGFMVIFKIAVQIVCHLARSNFQITKPRVSCLQAENGPAASKQNFSRLSFHLLQLSPPINQSIMFAVRALHASTQLGARALSSTAATVSSGQA